MRAQFRDINGLRTRILYAGDPSAYPLLLVHGGGITADTWLRNIDVLADQFFVVAPDMVGHGFTAPVDFAGGPPHPATVEHLAGVITHFGWTRVAVCGSSYGALISALLYFRLPRVVDKLIVCSSGSMFNTEEELEAALATVYVNAKSAVDNATLETCRRRLANVMFDPQSVPEEILLVQVTAYAIPGASEAWEGTVRGMMNIKASRPYRMLERLEQLSVRTLVVWGREDPRGHLASAEKAVARMPNAELVVFDRCGHLPYVEHPKQFNDLMRGFLSQPS